MRRLLLLASVAVALGCGGDSILGPVQTVDGKWKGTQNGYNLSMTLTQSDTLVSGTAGMLGVAGVVEGTVTGTFKYPNVNLTILIDQFQPVSYTGTMSQTQAKIVGYLDGSGFDHVEVDVARH
ncbi:MAG TPA: hypothetical protein VHB25_00090 [Gemmatimonadaceae bacterium]|nr:hypothetical protein [Gemmatimonadaceae bacterium]